MYEDCTVVARDPCSLCTLLPNVTQYSMGRLIVANLDVDSVNLEIRGTARVDICCKYTGNCNLEMTRLTHETKVRTQMLTWQVQRNFQEKLRTSEYD